MLQIPQGYQRIMPYLIVNDAPGFFRFMEKVFGATEKMKVMRNENHIMHAELQIGESTVMFADASKEFPVMNAGMFLYVENVDETYEKALAEGAASALEPRDQDYGRAGGIVDPHGNTWWITSPPKEQ